VRSQAPQLGDYELRPDPSGFLNAQD
jgi:hypothetical protein